MRQPFSCLLIFALFALGATPPAMGSQGPGPGDPCWQVFADGPRASRAALVVIDMQRFFVMRGRTQRVPGNPETVKRVIEAQKAAIEAAKATRIPVVFIEYETYGKTAGCLTRLVEGYDDSVVILKNMDGMFAPHRHKTELVDFLKSRGIDTLIVTGANGHACVKSSVQGALSASYNVYAFTDGIIDFNQPKYIHPFKELKSSIQCPAGNCTLTELHTLEEVIQVMGANGPTVPAVGQPGTGN